MLILLQSSKVRIILTKHIGSLLKKTDSDDDKVSDSVLSPNESI